MMVNYQVFEPILGIQARERIRSRERTWAVVDCRRVIAAQLKEKGYSLKQIGKELGCKHHTSIMYHIRSHNDLLSTNEIYRYHVERCGFCLLENPPCKP